MLDEVVRSSMAEAQLGDSGRAPAPLLVDTDGDRVVATLNRPDRRNAIDRAMIEALHELCAELEREPRTLILTGAGRTFAAGADIDELIDRDAADALEGINTRCFLRIRALPMPVIAAVDGVALGGGAELAYAADLRLGTPDARFGNPETGLGIIAAAGASWRLRELVGEPLALDLLLTGRIIGADEAYASGLVTELHPADELLPAAHAIADRIGRNDRAATIATKRAFLAPPAAHPELDLELQAALFESPEKRRRMREFLSRRERRRA